MTIVIADGSGFIGTELTKVLLSKNHTVIIIDKRGPKVVHSNLFYIPCDLEKDTLPFNVLERTDVIINLAQTSLATRNLVHSLEQTANKPSIFISASSTEFYGEGSDAFDERSPKGEGIICDTIASQEDEAFRTEELGCRTVIIRNATIIARDGIFAPLWRLARLRVGPMNSKKDSWRPWIHIADAVRAYLFAVETGTLQGIVNVVAPSPATENEIARAFRKSTGSIPTAPSLRFFLKKYTGAHPINQKVIPQRLLDKGFEFAFTEPMEAFKELKDAKN